MNKFLIAALIAFTPYNAFAKSVVEKEFKPDPGCVTKEVADNVINNGGYELLVRGIDPQKKIIEFWFSGAKQMVMLTYELPKDAKPESIKQVCVVGYGENIVFNGDTVDLLKKALDKVSPKT